jgi:hypothetical protein
MIIFIFSCLMPIIFHAANEEAPVHESSEEKVIDEQISL